MSFSDLGLGPGVLRAIEDAGYIEPTPIQSQAIPPALTGRDILGCAQTGTGKTAGFALPMIEMLSSGRARARMPRSLILTPTRELATQIQEHFEIYGKHHKLTTALLIGGVRADDQIRKLDRGVDVLIATPGRLLDHFENGRIILTDIKILVIDEADRMLDMGFIPDVDLADAFLTNPMEVSVAPPASPAATVTQHLSIVEERDKREALRRIIGAEDVRNALVFCNRKRDVDILYRSLKKHGFNTAALHGDMDQASRTQTLEAFKRNEITLLVASDVAARGLDIEDLSHVFNFDVPMHPEDYVHRIGRTGRAGKEGRAFTLATPGDGNFVDAITRLIDDQIPAYVVEGMESQELGERSPRGRSRRRGRDQKPSAANAGSANGERPKRRRERKPVEAEPAEARRADPVPDPQPPDHSEAASSRAKRGRRQRSGDGDQGDGRAAKQKEAPVIGMGDHVPAFMRRRARPPDTPDQL
jgi:superfamily II DNA/RNA helicase